jgi:hypothetical protein
VFKKGLAALAALAVPAVALIAPAEASAATTYKAPVVKSIGKVRYHGDLATVDATYKCYGGNEGTHIWVSLKQGPQIASKTIDQLVALEGTSAIAKAYYDTNPTDQQEVYIVCNGHTQHQTFKLTREEGKDRLTAADKKKTFLQFCLFDSHSPQGPGADPTSAGFAYAYEFVDVKYAKKLRFHYDH